MEHYRNESDGIVHQNNHENEGGNARLFFESPTNVDNHLIKDDSSKVTSSKYNQGNHGSNLDNFITVRVFLKLLNGEHNNQEMFKKLISKTPSNNAELSEEEKACKNPIFFDGEEQVYIDVSLVYPI